MRYRNAVLFLVLATVWGSAFTAIKAGLDYFPPVLLAASRYDLAAVLMVAYAVHSVDHWRPRARDEYLAVGVGAVLIIGAYNVFLFVGEQGTTSAAAAVLISLSPILTTVFSRLLLPSERLRAVGLAGLVLGFVGVIVLTAPDPGNLLAADTVSKALVFSAAVSFALGSVLTRRIDAGLPIETMEAWSMVGGAVVLHLASAAMGESPAAIEWTLPAVLAVGYLGIVAASAGFLIYFDLLERLGPIEINLVSYAAPVAAAITGVLLLGEVPTALTAAGFVLVLGGFLLIKHGALRAELRRL